MKKTIIISIWNNIDYEKMKIVVDSFKKKFKKRKKIIVITIISSELMREIKNAKYRIKNTKYFYVIHKKNYTIIAFCKFRYLYKYLSNYKNLKNLNEIFFLYNHREMSFLEIKVYLCLKFLKKQIINLPKSIHCLYTDEKYSLKKIIAKSLKRKTEILIKTYLLYISLSPFLFFRKIFYSIYSKKKEKHILKNPKKILFIRVDRFGDMVLSFSSIVALRKKFPKAEIYVLCSPMNADFLIEQNNINKNLRLKIIVWKDIWDMHGDFIPGLKELVNLIKNVLVLRKIKFDIIIQPISVSVWTLLSLFLKSNIIISTINRKLLLFRLLEPFIPIPSTIEKGEYVHCYYQVSNCLKPFGINHVDISHPKYDLKTLNKKIRKINLKKSIIINVSAGDKVRVLPNNKLKKLIKKITDTYNYEILLIGVEQDFSICEKISKDFDRVINLCGQTNINDLIYLFNTAKLLITPDTGTMHLASLCNIYIIAYFGAGILRHFAPITKNSYVIKHELGCSGCGDICFTKAYPKPCIDKITVDEILEAVRKVLKRAEND